MYSNMFKNLKSLFIVEDEQPVVKQETTQNTQNNTQQNTQNTQPVLPQQNNNLSANSDPKMMEILLQALEQNNLQGLDYLEFKQSIQATQNLQIDERTRFQSAYAMAQTMGMSYQKLVESSDYYLRVLEREQQRFYETLKQQGEGKNRTMIDEVAAMEQSIADKTAQIAQLQKEINDMQQQSSSTKQQVAEFSQKMEATKNSFDASYNDLCGQIRKDIEKINQYLK